MNGTGSQTELCRLRHVSRRLLAILSPASLLLVNLPVTGKLPPGRNGAGQPATLHRFAQYDQAIAE